MYPHCQEQEVAVRKNRSRKLEAFRNGRGVKVHSRAALLRGRAIKLAAANDAYNWMADYEMGMGL